MAEELIKLNTRKPALRIFMLLTLVLGLVWSWFVVRWYIGDTMAEYLTPHDSNLGLARRAVSLAPSDPFTRWRMGDFIQKQLGPEHLPEAIREFETAVSLSPNDYRLWVSLGTALEQQGEIERAEKGLRRAVELAPSYSYPRWYLGNLLLRSGRYTEAFAELRRASESDPQFRPQLFNLAWEVYSNDLESLKTVVGLSAAANADFSQYLLQRERFDDGLRIWHSLNDSDKRANSEAANRIIATLLTARRFHDAMAVWNGLVESPIHRAEVDKVLDGSFEQNVPHGAESVFGWQVKSISQLQVGIDASVRKSGQRSLRLTFQVASRLDKINVAQLVAVQPATEYEFECFVKTKGLSTAAPPLIQIVDAASGSVLASTSEVPIGENDNWLRLNTVFKSGDQSQGVIVRISRGSCGDNSVCPIYGSIWYDDFTITRRS